MSRSDAPNIELKKFKIRAAIIVGLLSTAGFLWACYNMYAFFDQSGITMNDTVNGMELMRAAFSGGAGVLAFLNVAAVLFLKVRYQALVWEIDDSRGNGD